jgi:hypothetical protein
MPSSKKYAALRKSDTAAGRALRRGERKTAVARGETGVGSSSSDAKRHRARRAKEKQLGRKLGKDEVVDHKKPIKSGGSNGKSNTRVTSRSKNASDGGKIGNRKGKAAGAAKGRRSK